MTPCTTDVALILATRLRSRDAPRSTKTFRCPQGFSIKEGQVNSNCDVSSKPRGNLLLNENPKKGRVVGEGALGATGETI